MRKIIFITSFLIITGFSFQLIAQDLNAFFYYSRYNTPTNEPYIETYISVAGNSANFVLNSNNKKQATVEVTMLFKKDTIIKEFRKYNLKSPQFADSIDVFPAFIDLQRIPLPNGEYNFELYLKDLNAENPNTFKYFEKISIDFVADSIAFSDIELVEPVLKAEFNTKFTKSGYHLVPYVSNFFPETVEEMGIYMEAYNLDKKLGLDEGFLIRYSVEVLHSSKQLDEFSFFQKQLTGPVNIVLLKMPIKNLPSGNYNLVIEFRDKQNNLLERKTLFFQRSNPNIEVSFDNIVAIDLSGTFAEKITSVDSLHEYIRILRPISDNTEMTYADNQLKSADLKLMQQFFYNFWYRRNQIHPDQEWKNYLTQVNYVNRFYSSQIKKGYETDRGRIYLQYGTPNSIADKKFESQYYPYEIWHYYEAENQRNIKFVFYKPNLAVNEYMLIHSTAKGEIFNSNWENMLRVSKTGISEEEQKANDDFDLVR